MKNIEVYQPLIETLLTRNIDFQADNQNEMLNIATNLYVCVEKDDFEEAVGYSVGSRLREFDFTLNQVNEVVDFIQEEIEREWEQWKLKMSVI